MRTTKTPPTRRSALASIARFATPSVVLCVTAAVLFMTVGCSAGSEGAAPASSETSAAVGANMAGPVQKIVISKQAVADKPKPWVLSDPESAVRSYLDWTSYAYRITESSAATSTMTAAQEVRVDSYVQLNLQKSKLLDQALQSITFGKVSVGATSTLLPAKEQWAYRYVSIDEVGKTLAGPYSADYETVYTLVKQKNGDWLVDNVAVRSLGEVK